MILLKFDTEIKGDSVIEGHQDWIECASLQFGVGRAISISGGGKSRDTSTPSFSEVTLSKSTDKASSELFAQAIYGKSLGKATIHFIQTSGDSAKPQVYLQYELTDPIISSYSLSSGGDRPTESFAINFTKISKKFNDFTDGATQQQGNAKTYDLMAQKAF